MQTAGLPTSTLREPHSRGNHNRDLSVGKPSRDHRAQVSSVGHSTAEVAVSERTVARPPRDASRVRGPHARTSDSRSLGDMASAASLEFTLWRVRWGRRHTGWSLDSNGAPATDAMRSSRQNLRQRARRGTFRCCSDFWNLTPCARAAGHPRHGYFIGTAWSQLELQ